MTNRTAIIGIGAALFMAAMIPYAYKARCAGPDCPPADPPYFGERGAR
jgi:hypothetical protein